MKQKYKQPIVTVDVIIAIAGKVILIKRKNPPYGWALPGGFVEYGESLEDSAVRETKEETSLNVKLVRQFHTYSDPKRDPRHHSITTVFIAKPLDGIENMKAEDDAADIGLFKMKNLQLPMAFDHGKIINDYLKYIW